LQSSADKLNKQLEAQLSDVNSKLDVTQRELNDTMAQKNHAQGEVSDLSRQLEEAENEVGQLTRAKQAMTKKMDEFKSTADSEAQAKSKLSSELRNAQEDLDKLRSCPVIFPMEDIGRAKLSPKCISSRENAESAHLMLTNLIFKHPAIFNQ